MTDPIRVEKKSGVIVVTLDGPRGNALSPSMIKHVSRALYQAEQLSGSVDEPQAFAVVLAGKPGVFCAGLDLKEGHALDRPHVGRRR